MAKDLKKLKDGLSHVDDAIWASLAVLSVTERFGFILLFFVIKKRIFSFRNFTRDANRQQVADSTVLPLFKVRVQLTAHSSELVSHSVFRSTWRFNLTRTVSIDVIC